VVSGGPVAPGGLLTLQHLVGNQAVAGALQAGERIQRKPATEEGQTAPESRTGLETLYASNYERAIDAVTDMWNAVGGVVDRQKDAVTVFEQEAEAQDKSSLAESIVVFAVETALGMALGGIGGAVTGVLSRTIDAAAGAKAQHGKASTAGIAAAAAIVAKETVKKLVEAGKTMATAHVKSTLAGGLGPARTPLLQFGRVNRDALNRIAIAQGREIQQQLAKAPEAQKWIVAQGLYDAFQDNLETAHQVQLNSMTDAWFTSQVRSVPGGARGSMLGVLPPHGGVLKVELESIYGNHAGPLKVQAGNLLGSGSSDTVRTWIAERTLDEVRIPKEIRMTGSLGRGILPHKYWIKVWAPQRTTAGPAISAANPDPLSAFMGGGEQRVVGVDSNHDGETWLAAYHLGLQDLDRDDERVTAENVLAGARKVWDNIKSRSLSSMGATVGNSEW
jgi:hypothetical protein